jgi:hypothetical protein
MEAWQLAPQNDNNWLEVGWNLAIHHHHGSILDLVVVEGGSATGQIFGW